MWNPTDIKGIQYIIQFLQVGTCRQENPIQKRSMEQYLRSMGHIFSAMGTTNPESTPLECSNLVCDNRLCALRLNIFPYIESSQYPSWSSISWCHQSKWYPKAKSDHIYFLDRFLLPSATQKILTVINTLCLHPLPTPTNATVHQNNPPPRHNFQHRGCQLRQPFVKKYKNCVKGK